MSNNYSKENDNADALEHYSRSQVKEFKMNYRTEEALLEVNNALNLNPKFAEAYTLRSELYEKMKLYDQALEDINYSISINNNNAESYYQRGLNIIFEFKQQFIGENNYLMKHWKIARPVWRLIQFFRWPIIELVVVFLMI
ncbi:unnamed protein product [Paramecium pentaurelia]|uniref:Tetratricopeptide repeat protein n=1 Tax=Paramecium pentaurelia TaxID=43138 RepID=A0A8S1VQF2_9CILI|nr:unnamed protein product [Paramecium pentaurelia]